MVGLIHQNDECDYRYEIDRLIQWSADNNILLNSSKTKEIIIDFRKKRLEETQPIIIENAKVDIVDNFKYLGTTISHELKWEKNIEVLSSSQRRPTKGCIFSDN